MITANLEIFLETKIHNKMIDHSLWLGFQPVVYMHVSFYCIYVCLFAVSLFSGKLLLLFIDVPISRYSFFISPHFVIVQILGVLFSCQHCMHDKNIVAVMNGLIIFHVTKIY